VTLPVDRVDALEFRRTDVLDKSAPVVIDGLLFPKVVQYPMRVLRVPRVSPPCEYPV
jgi:hypothetical protein